jgi:hypothetical protein
MGLLQPDAGPGPAHGGEQGLVRAAGQRTLTSTGNGQEWVSIGASRDLCRVLQCCTYRPFCIYPLRDPECSQAYSGTGDPHPAPGKIIGGHPWRDGQPFPPNSAVWWAYFLLRDKFGLGQFGGNFQDVFSSFLYFSTETYTSLGLGDIYPMGKIRMLTGIEALTGLVMISWTASFTYLEMMKYWRDS